MSRTIGAALVACLLAAPALGEPGPPLGKPVLPGHWRVISSSPDYIAVVLIDLERRVTFDAPVDNGRPASFRGYIAETDGAKIKFVLTDGKAVAHIDCTIQSTELLQCRSFRLADRHTSPPYLMIRVGDGPRKLR